MPDALDTLHAAIHAGDPAAARAVLADHPDLKSAALDRPLPHGSFGGTAMLAAARRGHLEIVDLLLAAGADINVRSDWWAGGFGVLDEAPPAIAGALIERGAQVTAHAAARLGLIDRLHALVAADPSVVHARGGDGQTPLHFASTIEIADDLLAHGADIDALDVDHESTPAQWMLGDVVDDVYPHSRRDIARFLVARGCRTDLLMASALGELTLVRKHLDDDPSSIRLSVSERWFPKRDPRAGGTIYIWTLGANRNAHRIARASGHDDVLALLMARSPADLQLAVACELGDEALVSSLTASHPDLVRTLRDEDRRRLADAAQDGNVAAVRLMLEAGWPVDARGQHGATALHWAAFHGHAAMAREILSRRPPLDALSTEFASTPLQWALHGSIHGVQERSDHAGTVGALIEAGAPVPSDPGETSNAVREVLGRYNRRG